jgi:hypothetical protein
MQGLPTVRTQLTKPAFFAAVLGMVAVGWALPLTAQVADGCDEMKLPDAVSHVLKEKFPSWRPKQISDLDTDDQQLWKKAHDKQCPGIAEGHFERLGQTAYAVLLVPDAKPTSGYKLVVLTKSGSGYAARVLDQADGQTYSGLVISSAAPGKFSDFENTKSVQLKLDSIYLEWIEKGAQLFYWAGTRYHKLQVSD